MPIRLTVQGRSFLAFRVTCFALAEELKLVDDKPTGKSCTRELSVLRLHLRPRRDIVAELLAKLRRAWGAQQFGIVGHSAGGGTATVSPGPFAPEMPLRTLSSCDALMSMKLLSASCKISGPFARSL